MPRPPRIGAALLDMDGTLVDSHAAVERAWRAWAATWGADVQSTIAFSPGRPAEQTIRQVMPHLSDRDVQRAAAEQLALQYQDLDDVTAMPGLHELLATLAELNLPWAVVTSADPPLAAARLDAVGVVAPIVVTCLDVRRGKPDPEPFLHAAALLGVASSACLVVEDADAGVAAGRAAGMTVAGVHVPRAMFQRAPWAMSPRCCAVSLPDASGGANLRRPNALPPYYVIG